MVGVGLQRLYAKQHVDGGWGWWHDDESSPTITAYVVFGLAKAKQAGFLVDQDVLDRGVRLPERKLDAPEGPAAVASSTSRRSCSTRWPRPASMEPNRAGALYEAREGLSTYGKAYLALALSLINDEAAPKRIETLLADISGQGDHQRHLDALGGGLDRLLEHEHRHPHHLHRAGHAGQARPEEQPGARTPSAG